MDRKSHIEGHKTRTVKAQDPRKQCKIKTTTDYRVYWELKL